MTKEMETRLNRKRYMGCLFDSDGGLSLQRKLHILFSEVVQETWSQGY